MKAKKFLAIALTLMLVVACFAVSALAVDEPRTLTVTIKDAGSCTANTVLHVEYSDETTAVDVDLPALFALANGYVKDGDIINLPAGSIYFKTNGSGEVNIFHSVTINGVAGDTTLYFCGTASTNDRCIRIQQNGSEIGNGPTVTINNVTIDGTYSTKQASAFYVKHSTLNMNNSTIKNFGDMDAFFLNAIDEAYNKYKNKTSDPMVEENQFNATVNADNVTFSGVKNALHMQVYPSDQIKNVTTHGYYNYTNCTYNDTKIVADGWIGYENAISTETVGNEKTVTDLLPAAAKIGDKLYATLPDAIAAAQSGDTIELLADIDASGLTITLPNGVTLKSADEEKPVVITNATDMASSSNHLTFEYIQFKNTSATFTMRGSDITFAHCKFTGSGNLTTIKDGQNFTFSDCTFDGGYKQIDTPSVTNLVIDNCVSKNSGFSFIYYGYLYGKVSVKNSNIHTYAYTVHTGNGGNGGTQYEISDTILAGWTSYGGEVEKATFTNCTFKATGTYKFLRPYRDTTFINCEFNTGFDPIGSGSANLTYAFYGCTVGGEKLTVSNFDTSLGLSGDTEEDHSDTLTVILDDSYRVGNAENAEWAYADAKIGNVSFINLRDAFEAAQDGDTITLLKDVTQDDGILFNKKNVTAKFDLNGKTFTVNAGGNVNNRAIRIDSGELEVYNGKIVAVGSGTTDATGAGCYGAFRVEANGVLNAHDLELTNSRPWGLNVKVLGGEVTMTDVTITSSYGGGIEVTEAKLGEKSKPGTATLTNCTFNQTNYFDHCSTALSVSGGSTLNIKSGTYTGEYALYVFSSGGVINVEGGTFTAKTKNTMIAAIDTNTYDGYTGGFKITGGRFVKGNMDVFDITSPAYLTITGGTFDADPSKYVADKYAAKDNGDGTWTVMPKALAEMTEDELANDTTVAAINDALVTNVADETAVSAELSFVVNEGIDGKEQTVSVEMDYDALQALTQELADKGVDLSEITKTETVGNITTETTSKTYLTLNVEEVAASEPALTEDDKAVFDVSLSATTVTTVSVQEGTNTPTVTTNTSTQPVSLSTGVTKVYLPYTKTAEEADKIFTVYFIDDAGNRTNMNATYEVISGKGYFVFETSHNSVYAVNAFSLETASSNATEKITVKFEQVGASRKYQVMLYADNTKYINGFTDADMTFDLELDSAKDTLFYTVEGYSSNEYVTNVTRNGSRYMFSLDGIKASEVTGASFCIGYVTFGGYGKGYFGVDTGVANANNDIVNTTTSDQVDVIYTVGGTKNVIFDKFTPDAGATKTNMLRIEIEPAKSDLTINVTFPNEVKDQAYLYQDMTVTISGGDLTAPIVFDLGSDKDSATSGSDWYENDLAGEGASAYGVKAAFEYTTTTAYSIDAAKYTITLNDILSKYIRYTVTVEGAGYRTTSYTIYMNDDAETLTFWNNVMDVATVVEAAKANSAVRVNYLAGDIVKDAQINIYDLSAVVSYFGTENPVSAQSDYAKYDLNRDGKIDSIDVAYVLVSWGN